MPDIKLIAMDMDGTLLGKEPGVIPPENLAALREAGRRGIHLCLASGRAADDAGFYAVDAGLDMHIIAMNGAMILHEPLGEAIAVNHLPAGAARTVFALAMGAGVMCAAFCDHEVIVCFADDYTGPRKTSWGTFMTRKGGRTVTLVDNAAVESRMERISKFIIVSSHEPERIAPLRKRIQDACPDLELSSSWAGNIEVNAPGINKGTALCTLARSLGVPMENVMALGDHDNDVPMLRAAGFGVAMGNASPAALAAADYITLPCAENGVAAAIRALALGEEDSRVKRLR